MNISSKSLGKGIVITVSIILGLGIISRIVYVLNEGSPALYGSLIFNLTLSAILFIQFWKAKDWARITLGILFTLRGIIVLGASLFFSMSDGDSLPYLQVLLHLAEIAIGVLLLGIPCVGRYLRSLNS